MKFSITTFSIPTLSITAFNIATFSIRTFGIMIPDTVMLSVVMMNVVMLSVIMLNVAAPLLLLLPPHFLESQKLKRWKYIDTSGVNIVQLFKPVIYQWA